MTATPTVDHSNAVNSEITRTVDASAEAHRATSPIDATRAAEATPSQIASTVTLPTATIPPTSKPTRTPRPTRTAVPTATPALIDLASYLTNESDVFGEFLILRDDSVGVEAFAAVDGLVEGRRRHLAKADPPVEIIATCGEYRTPQEAEVAVQDQHTVMMSAQDIYIRHEDDRSEINADNSYLAGGTMADGSRPVAVSWFHSGSVMCFNIVLGVPGSDAPPRGAAIDAANGALDRLAQAAAPTPTPIPGGPGVYDIGDTVKYEDGFSIAVKTVENPVIVNGEPASPGSGIVLTAIEIEACASSTTTDAFVSPLSFEMS